MHEHHNNCKSCSVSLTWKSHEACRSHQHNWIELLTFLFLSLAFATEMAMHWMKMVSTMITFVNPVSFVPWATLKKSEKKSRNWISSKWRQNGLIQHLREKFLCLCTSPRCLPWVLWSLWFCFLRIKTLWWQKCDCWRWTQHSITNREPSAHENSVTTFQKTEASQHKF